MTIGNTPEMDTFGPLERKLVVALCGAAGSGKSTSAAYLHSQGFELVKLAGPLKDMMRVIGMTDAMIEGHLKEQPVFHGKTPRHAMQTIGTEWGRDCMGPDFWVNLWKERAKPHMRVVCDDCRFPNEAEAIRGMGGVIIRLEGRGGIAGTHQSEKQSFEADYIIENTGSIADLHSALERIIATEIAA